MSNPMAFTLDQFNTGRTNFQQHYYLSGCNTDFDGQDIKILWADLAGAVNSFITGNNVPAASVALRFVYCYDSPANSMYLRLQILTMTADPVKANTYNLNATPCAWYKITEGTLESTTDTSLSDAAYLSDFYYCNGGKCNAENTQELSANLGVYAQNIVFPWSLEIAQLYTDNGSPAGAKVAFASIANNEGAAAPVQYPHSLAIYLIDAGGQAMLNNNPSNGFTGKAADLGTLCPFNCGIYQSPSM